MLRIARDANSAAVLDGDEHQASVGTVATPREGTPAQRWAPVLVGGTIAAVAVIGAPIAAAAISKPATPARTCPDGRRAEPLIGGAAVRLVGPGAKNELDEFDELPPLS